MKYDQQYLYMAYNATSTDDGTGRDEIETYENWLERQIIARLERIDELEKQFKVGAMYNEVVEQTHDEKVAMYNELEKEKLIAMLIECNNKLDMLSSTTSRKYEIAGTTCAKCANAKFLTYPREKTRVLKCFGKSKLETITNLNDGCENFEPLNYNFQKS